MRRVAVVTGGSSGIGAAIARRLVARGWTCVLLARGRERLEALAAELGAEPEVCDVAERAEVEAAAARVAERHDALGLLVNNAGIPAGGNFLDLDAERIEAVTRVNYLGGVWCLRAFLPLLERGRPSHVVNVASVAGTIAFGAFGPYAAAKHAQLAFSRSVAGELRPRGIRVHAVNPGPVPTDAFPQRRLLRSPWLRHAVVEVDRVADAVVDAVEHDRQEVVVPGFFRLAGAVQGLAPGTLTRLAARRAPRASS